MMRTVSKLQKGFTLIEVMVVVVILGVLAALIVPNVIGKDDEARVKATAVDLKQIAGALDQYRLDNHKYPTTEEGLAALQKKPASAKVFPDGGYLQSSIEDPWGNPFQYVSPGSNGRPYDLYSFGADGVEGGEGMNADIYLQ
jgi:general secretion pathway protein G